MSAPEAPSRPARATSTPPRPQQNKDGSPRQTDPRIRARQVAVARQAGQTRLRRLGICFGALALVIGALELVHSPLFSARALRVFGAKQTSAAAVLQASGLSEHPPLLDINADAMAQAVEALPWVKSATIKTSWPDGVSVVITERVAVAYVGLRTTSFALLDESGRVLALLPRAPNGLLRVTLSAASSGRGLVPGARLAGADRQLAALAGAVPQSLVPRIADISRDRTQGLVMQLSQGPQVVLGTASDLGEKLTSLATLLANGVTSNGSLVDLRVPSAPVLTP